MAGAGPLYDTASHRIDLMNYLFGRPVRVSGHLSALVQPVAVEDNATVMIEYETGIRGVVDVRWHCRTARDEFRIRGTDGELDLTPGLSSGAWQMRPLSRGYVEARSNRPSDMPAINPRYLSEESDRRAIVGGLRFARRLYAAPALQMFVREETLPGAQVQNDDELLDYARRNGNTCYHASCTCMMGQHAMAVVDSELRVHGLDGLRVIDASVMPTITSGNTNAPTMMIAEKGAAMLREDAKAS